MMKASKKGLLRKADNHPTPTTYITAKAAIIPHDTLTYSASGVDDLLEVINPLIYVATGNAIKYPPVGPSR